MRDVTMLEEHCKLAEEKGLVVIIPKRSWKDKAWAVWYWFKLLFPTLVWRGVIIKANKDRKLVSHLIIRGLLLEEEGTEPAIETTSSVNGKCNIIFRGVRDPK